MEKGTIAISDSRRGGWVVAGWGCNARAQMMAGANNCLARLWAQDRAGPRVRPGPGSTSQAGPPS